MESDVSPDGQLLMNYLYPERGDLLTQKTRGLARARELGVPFAFSNHDLIEEVLKAKAAREKINSDVKKPTA